MPVNPLSRQNEQPDEPTTLLPAGNPQIVDAGPATAPPGESTTVLLTIENQSSGSDSEAIWIYATSPQFSIPLIHYCVAISPGETREFGTGIPSYFPGPFADFEEMGGSFTMPPRDVQIDVQVGGLPDGTHCRNVPLQPSDETTFTISPPFNEDDIVADCRGISQTRAESTEGVTVQYTVENTSVERAEYVLEVTADGNQIKAIPSPSPLEVDEARAGSTMIIPSEEGLSPGTKYDISVDILSASPA